MKIGERERLLGQCLVITEAIQRQIARAISATENQDWYRLRMEVGTMRVGMGSLGYMLKQAAEAQ